MRKLGVMFLMAGVLFIVLRNVIPDPRWALALVVVIVLGVFFILPTSMKKRGANVKTGRERVKTTKGEPYLVRITYAGEIGSEWGVGDVISYSDYAEIVRYTARKYGDLPLAERVK